MGRVAKRERKRGAGNTEMQKVGMKYYLVNIRWVNLVILSRSDI